MTSRKDFLAAGALAALVPAAAQASTDPTTTPSPVPTPSIPPLTFDLAAFDAACARRAEHRHMFASKAIDGGSAFDAVKSTLDAYAAIGVEATAVATSVVLYHFSFALGFDDDAWLQIFFPAIARLPEDLRTIFDPYKNAKSNPFFKSKSAFGSSYDQLAKGGTLFYVCNNATRGFSFALAKALGRSPADVYRHLAGGLLPGASLVPAGVWAIHALQERRFTYLQATM